MHKLQVVTKNSGYSVHYLKDLFLRHPKFFMKSFASFKAKERYLKINMGRNLKKEEWFPIILNYNLNAHIKPRFELLLRINQNFDMKKALLGSDEEFWQTHGFTIDQLEDERAKHEQSEEVDILWRYVPVH